MQLKQLENNKRIAEDYHNMGYKMKGSPAKLGTIQGTSGHTSALKTAMEDTLAKGRAQQDASPAKGWLGDVISNVKDKVKSKVETIKENIKTRKAARPKRKAAKDVTRKENLKIASDKSKARVASNLAKRQTKAETNKNEKGVSEKAIRKAELKTARGEGRASRRAERHQEKLDRAGESREERLTRKRARNEKWGDIVDQVFNPEEARKTARLKTQQASEERIAKEKTRGAEEVAKTQAAADVEGYKRKFPNTRDEETDTEKRAKKKTMGPHPEHDQDGDGIPDYMQKQ